MYQDLLGFSMPRPEAANVSRNLHDVDLKPLAQGSTLFAIRVGHQESALHRVEVLQMEPQALKVRCTKATQ